MGKKTLIYGDRLYQERPCFTLTSIVNSGCGLPSKCSQGRRLQTPWHSATAMERHSGVTRRQNARTQFSSQSVTRFLCDFQIDSSPMCPRNADNALHFLQVRRLCQILANLHLTSVLSFIFQKRLQPLKKSVIMNMLNVHDYVKIT